MLTEIEFARLKRLGAELFYMRRHKKRRTNVGQEWRARCPDWTLLGAGHYGEAWTHSAFPEYAIKISGPSSWGHTGRIHYDWFTYRLDAWPVFARHCIAHPHKHLPAILHFEQVSQGMAWAIMPRYSECASSVSVDFRNEVHSVLCGPSTTDMEWLWPLAQMVGALEFDPDIHSGNVMWDEVNSSFILTDPFST